MQIVEIITVAQFILPETTSTTNFTNVYYVIGKDVKLSQPTENYLF